MNLFSWAVIMHCHKIIIIIIQQIVHKSNISFPFNVALFSIVWPEVIRCMANGIKRIFNSRSKFNSFRKNIKQNKSVPILSIFFFFFLFFCYSFKITAFMKVNQYIYFVGIRMYVTFRLLVEDIENSQRQIDRQQHQ